MGGEIGGWEGSIGNLCTPIPYPKEMSPIPIERRALVGGWVGG